VVLFTDIGETTVHVASAGAVGVGGEGGVVSLFVGVVGGGVFLLLEGDGEAEVAVFLREGGVIQEGVGGAGGAGGVRHVDIVRVGRLGFFTHGRDVMIGVGAKMLLLRLVVVDDKGGDGGSAC